jgi:hypothetical protein
LVFAIERPIARSLVRHEYDPQPVFAGFNHLYAVVPSCVNKVSLKESVLGQANVKAIYGEPISAHEKTIIPVAKIMYGYGAGCGHRRRGRYQHPRRRWGWWRRRTDCSRRRYRGEQPADPFRSYYGPEKVDRCSVSRYWLWYVVGLAQTSLIPIACEPWFVIGTPGLTAATQRVPRIEGTRR